MKTISFPFPTTPFRLFPARRSRVAQDRPVAGNPVGENVAAPAAVVTLTPGKVIRVDRASGVSGLVVESGIVWATDTPSSGDLILEPGGNLGMQGRWPVVLQALTESVVRFR